LYEELRPTDNPGEVQVMTGAQDFKAILELRKEMLQDGEQAELYERAVDILLNYTSWSARIAALKPVWGDIQSKAEMRRRSSK